MAEAVRIIGHNKGTTTNEELQAQVETDGALRVNLLDRYKCSDMDESSDPAYYGFVDADGAWYILELNTASGTLRYYKGASAYTVSWALRAELVYDYYYNVF